MLSYQASSKANDEDLLVIPTAVECWPSVQGRSAARNREEISDSHIVSQLRNNYRITKGKPEALQVSLLCVFSNNSPPPPNLRWKDGKGEMPLKFLKELVLTTNPSSSFQKDGGVLREWSKSHISMTWGGRHTFYLLGKVHLRFRNKLMKGKIEQNKTKSLSKETCKK